MPTPMSPVDRNAFAAFFNDAAVKENIASAPIAGGVQLADGNYVFQLKSAVLGPKKNKPGVLQLVWRWIVASGDQAGQEYVEYDDYDKSTDYFQMRIGFFKARIMAFGYDPNDPENGIVFGPNVNDALEQVAAHRPAVNVTLVTSESTKTNAAGVATTYRNQNLRVQGPALVASEPEPEAPPVQQVAKRTTKAPKAEAHAAAPVTTPALTPPVVEPAKPAVPTSGGVPVVEDAETGVVFLPNMKVAWSKKNRKGELERFEGDLIEAPDDDSLPFKVRREGTDICDLIDDLEAAQFTVRLD